MVTEEDNLWYKVIQAKEECQQECAGERGPAWRGGENVLKEDLSYD